MNVAAVAGSVGQRPLPAGWRWARLGDVAEYINGRAFKPNEWRPQSSQGVPIIRIENLNDPAAEHNYFDGELEEKHAAHDGDLLISWAASLDAYLWSRGPAAVNQHIFRVLPNLRIVDKVYLYYASRHTMAALRAQVHGSTMRHITKPEFEMTPLPLPPLPEQRRIAAILIEQMAAVDRAKAAVQAQLEAAKALPVAYLREVFPREGEPLPEGWRWVRLGDVADVVTGTTPPRGDSRFFGGTVPWVKPDDLDRSTYVNASAEYLTEEGATIGRIVPGGSVLLSCIGKIGKSAIAAKPLATNQQINALVPSERVDSVFLYFSCKASRSSFEAMASSTIVPIVNKSACQSIGLPLPSLPEQRRIAAILTGQMVGIDRLTGSIDEESATLDRLPATLLAQAFSGGL